MSWWQGCKVVVDTNVFVSGLMFGGKPGKVLGLISHGKIKLVTSPEIEAEVLSKLEKFGVESVMIDGIIALFRHGSERVLPIRKLKLSRDAKDDIFLETAVESEADFLVTGDKDLLVLKKIGKTEIVRPAEFMDIIKKYD